MKKYKLNIDIVIKIIYLCFLVFFFVFFIREIRKIQKIEPLKEASPPVQYEIVKFCQEMAATTQNKEWKYTSCLKQLQEAAQSGTIKIL